jgi:hypothetical protein
MTDPTDPTTPETPENGQSGAQGGLNAHGGQRGAGEGVNGAQAGARRLDVQGRCPACRRASLFLGSGGHVTCARLDCPDPCAADKLLHGDQPAPLHAATEPREHCGNLMPSWTAGPRNECVLRPGHHGSHADSQGARWWHDPGTGPAHNAGPSVAECAADDRAHWERKYAGEGQ